MGSEPYRLIELWDGRYALVKLATVRDDPAPWITKIASVEVFERRAGALRRVLDETQRTRIDAEIRELVVQHQSR